MSLNVSLVIVPSWMEGAMQANRLSMDRVLDLPALSRIFCTRDVSFYSAMQLCLWEHLPAALRQTFNLHELMANDLYVKADNNGNRPSPEAVQACYASVRRYAWDRESMHHEFPDASSLLATLPHLDHSQDAEATDMSTDLVFDVFYIDDHVYGIRFARKDPKRPYTDQLKDSYDNLMKLLSGHFPMDVMANTAAFEEYVRLARFSA